MTTKEQVKKLWSYCFTDSDEYVDYYFDNIYDEKNNYTTKEDERIVCSLMANKYKISIDEDIQDTSYIVGVSSSPVDRGSGYASKLIKDTLNDLYKKGEEVSMLMPIDTKIYTRYGFANIYDMLELDIDLDRIDAKNNALKSVVYHDENLFDLIDIYNQCMHGVDVFFSRDENYYKKLISEVKQENGEIIICYYDDMPVSYMIFYPKHNLGKSGFVREIFSVSISGYDKLFFIIKSHFTQMKNIVLHTYYNCVVHHYFESDNTIKYNLKPFMMMRVLDVKKSLEKIAFTNEISATTTAITNSSQKTVNYPITINIKIADEIIAKNNTVFAISTGKVEKTKKKPDIILNIYDFAKLYAGYEDIETIVIKNNIDIDGYILDVLKKLFPKKTCYFNDYV